MTHSKQQCILGTHFVIPLVQTPIIFDVKTNPKVLRTNTGSKDLQNVNLTLRILYRPIITGKVKNL